MRGCIVFLHFYKMHISENPCWISDSEIQTGALRALQVLSSQHTSCKLDLLAYTTILLPVYGLCSIAIVGYPWLSLGLYLIFCIVDRFNLHLEVDIWNIHPVTSTSNCDIQISRLIFRFIKYFMYTKSIRHITCIKHMSYTRGITCSIPSYLNQTRFS